MEYTLDTPLPPVRDDVTAIEITPDVIALYDDAGYAEGVVRIPIRLVRLLAHLDGILTASDVARMAAAEGIPFESNEFISLVAMLDSERFVESRTFRAYRESADTLFNEATLRPAAFQGSSYPDDQIALTAMLDRIIAAVPEASVPRRAPAAVIAPHIDFRVGGNTYGPAYSALSYSNAQTFVIFGTSHAMSYDEFMISTMDFDTPLGVLPVDREFIARYREALPFSITSNQIAHRREHSIEFQAVFLRHIFRDRDVKIVPILTGSLFTYVEHGKGNAGTDKRLTILYETLNTTARQLRRSICYIAGADLSHVGRKFGDEVDAHALMPSVRDHDLRFLDCVARGDTNGLIETVSSIFNRYRICGTAPIYAAMRSTGEAEGQIFAYDQWDERERGSAVTFASAGLYTKDTDR